MEADKTRVQRLREGWEWCLNQRDSNVFARARLNWETRYCVWANQSADGKKWKADAGKEIFPWEGASDARVPLVDTYIREDTAFLMTVWRRMRVVVSGVEMNDAGFANRMTQLNRWLLYTQMTEAPVEHRLLASYGLERGAAVMGVFWNRERQMGYEDVDLERIMGMASDPTTLAQIPELAELPGLILNPATEEEAVQYFKHQFPEAKDAKLAKLVKELRTFGHGRIAVPETVKDRPKVVALCLNEDVFLPPEATDIESGGEVYWRELLTEAQLRERRGTLGWNEDWVDAVIATQKGKITGDVGSGGATLQRAKATGQYGGLVATSRLYEVVHSYVRQCDEEDVPEIRYTCFNPAMLASMDGIGKGSGGKRGRARADDLTGRVAIDQALDYQHAKLPFVLWEREKRSRLVDDARGYGEIAATMQRQIKVEWDSRVDRAAIATLPPMYHPAGQEPERWGPGVRIGSRRPDEYGFVQPPRYDPGSKQEEMTARAFADQYFGRPINETNMTDARTMRQDLADVWMETCGQVNMQILQLCQQFMADDFYFRVVGSSQGKGIHATKEEIQGQFDLMVGYNVENMDAELKAEKFNLIEKMLSWDVNGIVDRDEAMLVATELVDPSIGERLLKPKENATQGEIEDEDMVFAKMSAGVPVDIKPGQAYELRLQRLTQIIESSPPALERYEKDENFRKLIDWRMQQLKHQLEQRENAKIGRLGGKAGFDQFSK